MTIRKNDYIIAAVIFLIYLLIGYVFNIGVLKIITLQKDKFSISIAGVIIFTITSVLLQYIVRKNTKK